MTSLIYTLNFKNFVKRSVRSITRISKFWPRFFSSTSSLEIGANARTLQPFGLVRPNSRQFLPIFVSTKDKDRGNDPGAARFTTLSQGTLIPYTLINTAFLAARMVWNGNDETRIAPRLRLFSRFILENYTLWPSFVHNFRSRHSTIRPFFPMTIGQEKTYDRLR